MMRNAQKIHNGRRRLRHCHNGRRAHGANGFVLEQSTASERQAAGEAGAKAKRPGTR